MAYLQEKTKLRNIILESVDGTNTGSLEDYYINMKDGSWGLYGGNIMDNNGNIYSNGLDNELLHFRTTSIGDLVDEYRELYLTKNEYITKVFNELDSKIKSYQIENFSDDAKIELAINSNDINILETLSKDENKGVRESVLDNKNCPKEIVTKLCEDKDDYISSKAMEKLSTFEHNLKETINEASNYSSNVDESTSKNNHKHR